MKNLILGIESSCDDSSLALMDINSFKLEFYKKISQEEEHFKYGGVVPELAARLHTSALPKILEQIKPKFNQICAIAVTNEPGLSVSLISGVSMAKALSISLNLPLIEINHLIGHIFSLFLDKKEEFPLGVLLVSGGHTLILDIDEKLQISIIAKTTDDSFGESFDKVAKMMNLGYPGGKIIEDLAKNGDENFFKFTIPLVNSNRLEYSFSGLKNQVRLVIENSTLTEDFMSNVAASFQKTACLHIINKLNLAFKIKKWKKFGVVGGASANLFLREQILKLGEKFGCQMIFAPLNFTSDNAAMIARTGVYKYNKKIFCDLNHLEIRPKFENLTLYK